MSLMCVSSMQLDKVLELFLLINVPQLLKFERHQCHLCDLIMSHMQRKK